ncbi:uncharacterized protein LOC115624903 [Scaptodrosophila lebanonensis]|uniref:Uncharacterized protein LOC115624903 n=1 Tax=Drosophila lebanonensis TaxID=7225 RepID=A0A6J2TKR1_DROLE|nr:uncharacterized protein LOC115624903 [Scaptodrosophila lebanonensis]
MAFLRAFRRTNNYISAHALFLLRFYLWQYYHLGVLRLRYDRSRNVVQLTRYSITVSRLLGLPFLFLLSLALHYPYKLLVYMQPLVFMSCLVMQPSRTYTQWIALINRFLNLAVRLFRISRRKLRFSWFLIAQLVIKFLTLKLYVQMLTLDLIDAFRFLLIFVLPTSLCIWCIDISTHIVSLTLSILLKSFELLNEEIEACSTQLQVKIMQADYRNVERLNNRLHALQQLYISYSRLTQDVLDCLAVKLLLIVVYNLSMVYALSRHWQRFFEIGVLLNSVRLLFQLLDKLANAICTPYETSWQHSAQLLRFNEVLSMHGWLRRRRDLERQVNGYTELYALIQPQLQVLGLFTPNRRAFFRVLFFYCSYLYLHYMWHKRLPVAEREIFLVMSLVLKERKH